MTNFKSLSDLSDKQTKFLEEIKTALDCIDTELSKKLDCFIESILAEAYESGYEEHPASRNRIHY